QGPDRLHQRASPSLDELPRAARQPRALPRELPHVGRPELAGAHGNLPSLAPAHRAHRGPHDADAVPARTVGARAAPRRPPRAVQDDLRNVRAQRSRAADENPGAGGFEPARDVLALTVNRWPHGYAYQYNSLWDPFWIDGGPLPCVAARQRFGRIAIANADAAAYAYTDAAIDQAHGAVDELLGLPSASGAGAPLRVRTRTLRSSYVESCDETPGRWWPA